MRPALRWLPASLLVRPDAGGFAGTQHFAAQWPEPNALAKISFVSLRLAPLQKKREGMVARMNFAPMRETKRQ